MKAALLALLLSQATPAPLPLELGRPVIFGSIGEPILHFRARILVRACAFSEGEPVITRTMEALDSCGEDDSPCEFLICTHLHQATNKNCPRLGATPL